MKSIRARNLRLEADPRAYVTTLDDSFLRNNDFCRILRESLAVLLSAVTNPPLLGTTALLPLN
jgi:hypothetical protein